MTKFLRCFPLIALAMLTACGGSGVSNNTTSTKATAVLQSIHVSAGSSSIPAGLTVQLTATGNYSDGTSQNLSNSVAWTVSNSSVAAISASGLVTAKSHGSATITATSESTSGTMTLTVALPTLASITVNAASGSVAAGLTDQFTATGTYSDNSTNNITSSVTWTASNLAVGTISTSGLVTSKSAGSMNIVATSGNITGSATLNVGSATLVSITVNSAGTSVDAGQTDQFTASGIYSDGSSQNLTNSVSWSSSDTSVATIAGNGLVTGKSAGSATVTATSGSIAGAANLSVTISLVSLAVSPSLPTIAPNTTEQFHATGTFSDGSTQDVTGTVNWSSSDITRATIGNSAPTSGLAAALKSGTSTITASSGSISTSTTLTVSAATLASIAVTPAITTIPLYVVQQFTATGTFSDGTTQNITNTVTWSSSSSSSPVPVSITAGGAATANSLGIAAISAASGSVTGSLSVSVTTADLVSLSLQQGNNVTIAQGTSIKLNAIGKFTDGSTRDVSLQASWLSGNAAVATVQSTGRVQGLSSTVNSGMTTITATLGSQTASLNFNVTNATIVSVSVAPSAASVAPGTQLAFSATGQFSDSSTQVITADVHWDTSDSTIATVNNGIAGHGIVSALSTASGAVTISATFPYPGGVVGTAPLTVTTATLSKITLTPSSGYLAPNSTIQFKATGKFSDGTLEDLSNNANWTVSAPPPNSQPVATVTGYGLVTGQSAGTATITASFGSMSSSANILVETAGNLTSIVIGPSNLILPEQIIGSFTATGYFGSSAPQTTQDLTSVVGWTSSQPSVATVSNSGGTKGQATAISIGNSTIAASFGGVVSGPANLQVTNATLQSLAISPGNTSITLGNSQLYVATATFLDPSTMNTFTVNVSSQVSWSSSDVTVAVISPQGIASTVSGGGATTTITAKLNGVSATAVLTVN